MQYIGLNPLYLYPAGTNFHDAFIRYNGAFLGTLGNVDLLGAFLCLVVPLFYSTYLLTGIKKALIPFGTGAYLMMLADVDSGYLGLAAALILTVPLFFRRPTAWARGCIAFGVLSGAIGVAKLFYADHNRLFSLILSPQSIGWITFGLLLIVIGCFLGRRHWGGCCSVKALAVAILLLLCTALISVYAIPFSGGTAYELHQILHGNWDPSFGSGRIRIWQETLKLISETPFFGGGPGTLGERMPFTFTRYAAELGITIETIADTAHNDFLNIAVNEGIPALGFYLAMLACWIWRCCRHLDRKPVSLLLPCILAYLVQSCFTYSYCTAAALFWVFLALCEQTINTQKEELEK